MLAVNFVVAILLNSVALALGSEETADTDNVRIHVIESPYQRKPTTLRVLLPDNVQPNERCRVLFLLPVHEDGLFKHGDGLREVRKLDVHNKHQLICVAPAFTSKPWYADHDLNPAKLDESHLLRTVIPFVELNYPVRANDTARLLLGFSKSGWGAMTLLLRHPDKFARAVAWDPGIRIDTGPFEDDSDQEFRIRRDFGSDANFERFRVSSLIKTRGKELGDSVRLFYFNREGHQRTQGGEKIRKHLRQQQVPHHYVMDRHREHRWDSGWLPQAIEFLVSD